MGWSINAKSISIPEGIVKQIVANGLTLWQKATDQHEDYTPPEPDAEPDAKAKSETLICPVCGKEYTSQTWYDKHLLTHEEAEE